MTNTPLALQGWAARWAIPPAALADLLATMGAVPPTPTQPDGRTSEAYVQSLVRLEAPRLGIWLTRNNVGAKLIRDEKTGHESFVRWGLANETPAQNKKFKSGDLVGMWPKLITASMVGTTIGQFVSRECKHAGWSYSGNEHEEAQLNWVMLVTRYGGDARFAIGEGSFG